MFDMRNKEALVRVIEKRHWEDGVSLKALASELGISEGGLRKWKHRNGVRTRGRGEEGALRVRRSFSIDAKDMVRAKCKETPSGCWEWTGSRKRQGYGNAWYRGQRWTAHRLSFFAFTGQEPGDGLVCHKCDNPPCVNPDHLYLGGCSDNTRDMYERGRFPIKRGVSNPIAKLNGAMVVEARRRWRAGETVLSIAADMPTTREAVHMAIIGRTWAHIPGAVPVGRGRARNNVPNTALPEMRSVEACVP